MKFTNDPENPIKSEGKLLEVIPYIEMNGYQMFALPAVVWPVPNELMGFRDYHVMGSPYVIWMNDRAQIPGTNSAASHRLGFMVRIMEANPDNEPRLGAQIPVEHVTQILDAIRDARF